MIFRATVVVVSCCSGVILGLFGVVLGHFWAHLGVVLGLFGARFGFVLGLFWARFGVVLGLFCGRFRVLDARFASRDAVKATLTSFSSWILWKHSRFQENHQHSSFRIVDWQSLGANGEFRGQSWAQAPEIARAGGQSRA